MDQPQGILVFGANGSGKTTLGRELARILDFKHMDIEEYFFEPSGIPYTAARPREDCLHLMLADMEKYRSFVLSACTGDFGEAIARFYALAVYMSAPPALRLERVKRRSYEQHGGRILPGGDMYEQEQGFFAHVATRPLSKIDQWAQSLTCPVMRVDGTVDWRANAADIAEHYLALKASRTPSAHGSPCP